MTKEWVFLTPASIETLPQETVTKMDGCSCHHSCRCGGGVYAESDKLWLDHTTYTREVIMGILSNAPWTDVVLNRLLRNQVDLGDLFRIKAEWILQDGRLLTGAQVAELATALLTDHIQKAGALVKAVAQGSPIDAPKAAFYENGNLIGETLNSLAKMGSQVDFRHHMKVHLDTLVEETMYYKQLKWKPWQDVYDRITQAIIAMSHDILRELFDLAL